jgi:hypothetical protein
VLPISHEADVVLKPLSLERHHSFRRHREDSLAALANLPDAVFPLGYML